MPTLIRRLVTPCDLCGDPAGLSVPPAAMPLRFDASPFGLDGRICWECRDDLLTEAAMRRFAASNRRVVPLHKSGGRPPQGQPRLPVLDGPFQLEHLTPKAAAAVILAETRRVFARRRTTTTAKQHIEAHP